MSGFVHNTTQKLNTRTYTSHSFVSTNSYMILKSPSCHCRISFHVFCFNRSWIILSSSLSKSSNLILKYLFKLFFGSYFSYSLYFLQIKLPEALFFSRRCRYIWLGLKILKYHFFKKSTLLIKF
jgi:hypothetical protein